MVLKTANQFEYKNKTYCKLISAVQVKKTLEK